MKEIGECECNLGFQKDNQSCIEKYFTAEFKIYSIKLATLTFSENLLTELKFENLIFLIIDNSNFNVTLLKANLTVFSFSLSFKNEVKENTDLQLLIQLDKVYSIAGSQLKNYLLSSKLPAFSPDLKESPIILLGSTQSIAQAGVSSSVGASLMSNPAAAWSLVNSIQLIIFLPLNNNKMTPTLRTFLSGFSGYNLLPNYFERIFNGRSCTEPYLEARKYGIKSSVFFLNTGKIFCIFIIILLIWPVILVLSKCEIGKITAKAIKILGNYKYSFFLRFWIQSYLEILVYSLIQLKSVLII